MDTHIEVVDYDPVWPERYEAAADRVADALGDRLERTEHIGSTAVPGLAAKPVVDLRAMVEPDADLSACVDAIEGATAFEYVDDMRHWKLLRRLGEDDRVKAYNLHLTHVDGEEWRKNVRFRDYLREHPEAREEYAELKREAAAAHPDDVEAYTEAKTAFVERCLAAARSDAE